jgi:hypothetical protein
MQSSSDDASPVEDEGLPGGRWTGGETRLLKSLVDKYGTNWARVSEGFHGGSCLTSDGVGPCVVRLSPEHTVDPESAKD